MSKSIEPLLRRLKTVAAVSPEEERLLGTLPVNVCQISAGANVAAEFDKPAGSFVVLQGVLCGHKLSGTGKRQIVSFHFLGDFPDLQSVNPQSLDCNFQALTDSKIGHVSHEAISDLCRTSPKVAQLLERLNRIDASILREWLLNIGQRRAVSRLAHLLCEIFTRMHAVGLAEGYSCSFPPSQCQLGEAIGVSTVHTNRAVQALRRTNTVSLRPDRLEILDWPALQTLADFDPNYLHLNPM